MDYVDINIINDLYKLTQINGNSTKLIFKNLYWKTNKSLLKKHIYSLLNNNLDLEILNIKVLATNNGYPTEKLLL